ncbi:hypothetical protein DPMN_042734 [Dreissena polymorpha]|uniref:Uncharacterized protein n=1 Tax=Dreissena polymorpha TaxID=45954 RepID=A0A9D4CZ52_DREPO|nr:hypothetical protein DPMN_042734 [Dreissena polymorpha]
MQRHSLLATYKHPSEKQAYTPTIHQLLMHPTSSLQRSYIQALRCQHHRVTLNPLLRNSLKAK